jgi:tetratricopeptide (TPR) repeat protein
MPSSLPAIAILLAALAMPASALAQAFQLGAPKPTAGQLLADQWYLMATEALAGRSEPRDDQYTRARVLLEQAVALAPEDADLWKRRAELAERTGDSDARLSALSQYVDLRPENDRAMLDLILARVQSLQTVDARLRRLERVLNSRLAEQLSDPARSRLASEAAAAAAEMMGRENSRFLGHLKTALDLDASNEQAALMMFELLQKRHRSPERPRASAQSVAAATIHLTKAAPLDGTVRGTRGEHLAKQAVFELAARQFSLAQQITGGRMSARWHKNWIRCLAASGQTNAALSQIEQYARRLRNQSPATQPATQPEAGNAALEKATPTDPLNPQPDGEPSDSPGDVGDAGQGGETTPQPPQTREADGAEGLPVHMRVLRLAILYQPEQTARWHNTFDAIWAELSGPADEGRTNARLEAAWLAAVFDRKTEAIQPWLNELPQDRRRTRLAKGWLAYRLGELEPARAHLNAIAERDPMARFGLAMINGADEPGQARRMQQVVASAPQSLGGLMAARWLIANDREPNTTAVGRSLVDLMNTMPGELWRLNNVNAWLAVDWEIPSAGFAYLRPMNATLTIRNRTSLPISIGETSTLPPRTMVMIAPFQGGQAVASLPPKVVDVGQRLRLAGNQTLNIDVRLDRSAFGRLAAYNPFSSVSFNVTATVNPRATRRGGIVAGLPGGSDTARFLSTQTLPMMRSNVNEWLTTLDEGESADRFIALARLVQVQPTPNPEQQNGGEQNQDGGDAAQGDADSPDGQESARQQARERERIDQALVDRVEQAVIEYYRNEASARQRAWIVRMIAKRQANADRFQQVRELARRSDKPLVRIAYLANHVTEAGASSIQQAMRSGSSPIDTFAAALQKGLKARAGNQRQGQNEDAAGGGDAGNEASAPSQTGDPLTP